MITLTGQSYLPLARDNALTSDLGPLMVAGPELAKAASDALDSKIEFESITT